MEFCETCCCCIDLRKGAILMGVEIVLLCMGSIGFSIWNIILAKEESVSTYTMLLVTDVTVSLSVIFIMHHLRKKRFYVWYISLYMFIIVLCQLIEMVIMLTETKTTEFYIYELAISLSVSGSLFYFMMIVMSYFYSISAEGRFDTVQQNLTVS
ncbi:hypothetical protein ILUMI_02950 [Ignelater luminosus]|uniref:Uncharacterized protein n=1 Tax=Ignelater luminosus TaxID=2038154 RepID=A0A8K0DFJ9_IGNLU|nr:hypothetical protein ILUMI_02950 [Ignelater luminosus]